MSLATILRFAGLYGQFLATEDSANFFSRGDLNSVFATKVKAAGGGTSGGKSKKDSKNGGTEGLKPSEGDVDIDVPTDVSGSKPRKLTSSQCSPEMFENLVEKQKQIKKYEEKLKVKENVIKKSKQDLDEKMTQLNNIKKQVQSLLAEYETKEQQSIGSLVKIYENMKPKEAAKIFEELDMNILLQVISEMPERKSAPILANVSAMRATQISSEFARQNKLKNKMEEKYKNIK
jgi:flagellar motility protein MotE (MotC chaperone)